MSWSPREERAIAHYIQQNHARLELQPGHSDTVYLQDKLSGTSFTASLTLILAAYDQDRAERTKERARLRRAEIKAKRLGRAA